MRSINAFADSMTKSFKTVTTAQRALDKSPDWFVGSGLIVQRTDGRFAVIIVNPDPQTLNGALHNTSFGVWR